MEDWFVPVEDGESVLGVCAVGAIIKLPCGTQELREWVSPSRLQDVTPYTKVLAAEQRYIV